MAEVTEMTNSSTPIPPDMTAAPSKRPRGRPRKEAKPPIAEEEEEVQPEFSCNEDFWLMLQNFSDDEWNHLSAYVYRLAPKIDRKSNGRKANIQTYTSRFTPDDLMKDHGSGAYQIMLNHQDPATGKYSRLAVEKVQIINPKYPPVVPDGDWVEDKDNEMWKWGAKAVPSLSNGGSYPPGFNIADMMDKADNRALRMVEIMTPKKDDTEQTSLLLKLIDVATARNNAPAPPPPDTKQTDRLFEMLLEDRKQAREELALLRDKMFSTPPPKSIIEQFVELQPQIKGLVDGFATRAGKTDIWADIVKEGMGQLPELIELGKKMVDKAPAGAAAQPSAKSDAVVATLGAARAAEPPVSTKPIEQMTEDEKRAHVDHLWKKWGGHLISISTRLVEEFTIQDQGYSFRDWYVEMYGKLRWADLKRDIAPELMTNMYLAHEQLKKPLSPPERLNAFLVEFATNFGEEKGVTVEDDAGAVEPDEVIPAAKQTEAKS